MESGEELDALVAERIMGWRRLTCGQAYPNMPIHEGSTMMSIYWHSEDLGQQAVADSSEPEQIWCPSISLADAWDIVEKMKDKGFAFQLLSGIAKNHDNVIFFNAYDLKFTAGPAIAPLAICLAALKAHGVDV